VTDFIDTGTDTVRAWVAERVGVIELHRPDRRNALHEDMYDAVPAMIERHEADDAVAVLMITGAGKGFCAGGDVRDGVERARRGEARRPEAVDGVDPLTRMGRMVRMLHESPKLTIAALPGPAVGAGMGIALGADLRIAARSARLIAGWGQLGFSGDFGGTWFLTRLLGPSRALGTLVGNTAIGAEEALAGGLFHRVIDDEGFAEEALAWAASIAAGPQSAYRSMKQNVRDAQTMDLAEYLPLESERMRISGETEDHRDAVRRWLRAAKAKAKAAEVAETEGP
jgi:2-(1,2-epoxy-1,2-dihydrophenyl)acetyl-CoA isomerase